MIYLRSTCYCLIVFLVTESAPAQSLVTKFPPDGTEAIYDYERQSHINPRVKRVTKGTLTLRLTGTEVIDKKKYRWIEHETHGISDSGFDNSIWTYKMLVPADNAAKKRDFTEDAKLTWYRYESLTSGRLLIHQTPRREMFGIIAPESIKFKRIEPKTIKTELGALKSKGYSYLFENTKREDKSNMDKTTVYDLTIYSNDQTPFGSVELKCVQSFDRSKSIIWYKLKSVKKNAKSVLPDHWLEGKQIK